MKRLYVTDVDFTLLNSQKKLFQYSKNAISKFYDRGILFTIASARGSITLNSLLDGIKLNLPVIELNGAVISEFGTLKTLYINKMENNILSDIYNLSIKYNSAPIMSSITPKRIELLPLKNGKGNNYHKGMKWYQNEILKANAVEVQTYDSLENITNKIISTLTFIGDKEPLENILSSISSSTREKLWFHFYENLYDPGNYWINMQNKEATKDQAILKLRKLCNLNNTEIVVFGDSENDIGMLASYFRC